MLSLLRSPPLTLRSLPFLLSPQTQIRHYAQESDKAVSLGSGINGDETLRVAPPSGLSPTLYQANHLHARTSGGPLDKRKIAVKENHGLYGFFRKKEDEDNTIKYETVEAPEGAAHFPSGRSWKASELRLKSFKDLHTLWYVVLREQNLLATQKEEARRMGVQNPSAWHSAEKVTKCRKTMARIKYVINERRIAFEGACKLAEDQARTRKEHDEDVRVHRHNLKQWRKKYPDLRAGLQERKTKAYLTMRWKRMQQHRMNRKLKLLKRQTKSAEATGEPMGTLKETGNGQEGLGESAVPGQGGTKLEGVAKAQVEEAADAIKKVHKKKARKAELKMGLTEKSAYQKKAKSEEQKVMVEPPPVGYSAATSSLFGPSEPRKTHGRRGS